MLSKYLPGKLKYIFTESYGESQNNWKRNLVILCIAMFVTMIGMSSCIPFLPLYVRELGINTASEERFWSGMVMAGPYFLSIITVPIWGALGDKYGKKTMILRAVIGLAIAMSLMSFATNVHQLFILRIIQGGVSGFIAAALAFISSNTPHERTGYAIGLFQSSIAAGNIIGPFFGGVMGDLIGIRQVFLIVGACCLISGILVSLYLKEKKSEITEKKGETVISNLKYVLKNREMALVLILIIISQIGIFYTFPIFPFFLETLDTPKEYLSTMTGVFIGIIGILSIVFAPYWGRRSDRKDYKKTIKVTSTIGGTMIIMHIFVPHFWYLFPIRIVAGIFISAITPTLYAAASKLAPLDNKSGIMGLTSSANLFGSLVCFITCSVTASQFGLIWCFIISGFFLYLLAILTYFCNRKLLMRIADNNIS